MGANGDPNIPERSGVQFTDTQQRLVDVLSDGQPHASWVLHGCLNDELTPIGNLHNHLYALRKKLAILGHELITERHDDGFYYRIGRTTRRG